MDDQFGPHFSGVFDFTLLFEQSILSLLPTALFILLAPFRVFAIWKNESCVRAGPLLWAKLIAIAIFACLQVALIPLWSTGSAPRTKTSIAQPAVALVESIAILALSYFEHLKSPRPSLMLNTYLILSLILDIALGRTFWIRNNMQEIAAVFTASMAAKFILLILEEIPKGHFTDARKPVRETSAGVISRSVFWWLNPLLLAGSREILEIDHLEPVGDKFDSDYLLQRLERAWKEGNLLVCTLAEFKWPALAGVIPRLLQSAFNFAQPFLIQSVILAVGSPETELSVKIASGLIGATALVYVGMALSAVWCKHLSYQLVTMYRGALSSLIFKKTLNLNSIEIKDNAPVTLMSTDIDVITAAGESFHDIWANFVDLPIGIYLLYRQVGNASLLVLIPTVVSIICSGIISPAMEPATVTWNAAVQARIGETSTVLSQMKGIKMLGLVDFAYKLIDGLRIHEVKVSAKYRWLLAYLINLSTIAAQFSPMIVILPALYWKGGNGMTVAEAFTSISIIGLVTQPLSLLLVSLAQVAGITAGFGRIQAFLELREQKDDRSRPSAQRNALLADSKSGLIVNNDDLGTKKSVNDDIELANIDSEDYHAISIDNATFATADDVTLLHGIDLKVAKGSLTMLVGKIGCGKSSLLKAMIGEMVIKSGAVSVSSDTIAYCDQNVWLRNATVRDNIVGQSPYNEQLMTSVLRACALDEDVLSNFPSGDLTLVGSGGIALSGGQKQRVSLARALYAQKNIYVLDDIFSGLDNKTSNAVFDRLLGAGGWLRKKHITVVLATHNAHFLQAASHITMLEVGRIVQNQVTYKSIELSLVDVLGKGKSKKSSETESSVQTVDVQKPAEPETGLPILQDTKDSGRQTGDIECYKIYIQSIGWLIISVCFFISAMTSALEAMPNVMLKFWTENGGDLASKGYLGGYIGFVFGAALFGLLDISFFIIVGVPISSVNLHRKLLKTACRAPLYFFTSTDSGSILNRFSQDMTLIDQNLPLAFILTLELFFRIIVQIGVLSSGASYAAAFIPFAILCLYMIQKYYLRTSRQMRFLDIEMKAPLYTQFTETLAGLATVRSFGWSEGLMRDYQKHLNTSQRPYYLMFCIQRWLQVVLNLFVAGVAVFLVSLALRVSGASSQGSIALALVNLVAFNITLTVMIEQWTQLETSLGAIARLKAFAKETPDENKPNETGVPPADWPSNGKIEVENIVASYSSDDKEAVLQDVSLTIQPGQKVCLCGRTGSGKSSLLLSFLRLLELRSGTICIDDIDISTLSRQQVRSQLTTLPQEPLKLSGTIRHNLDPEDRIQADEVFINALTKATIWSIVESRGGLDAIASEVGFSVGQQQLFCLARALLSRSKIVLFDEATSSVDSTTEKEIRRIIKEEFVGRTIIEVAHRIQSIEEYDVAVVMGSGRVLEVGNPEELLGYDSELKRLWEAQGVAGHVEK
ncbi:unnamed protein product [Clonostachys byssicola]|uniref:ABC transporter n=1 Tax=Clonostachys byssicola TaxID=160290 RepID=A0A9N9V1F4_9HYPO|nr:unnamed protein product [Clonostachys byssicola]